MCKIIHIKNFSRILLLIVLISIIKIGNSYSQCSSIPGTEAVQNGSFENNASGSPSTFGTLVPCGCAGGYSYPGHYVIGTEPLQLSLNNHTQFYDHTKKDGTGQMMMIDGPNRPQTVWQQIVNVTPNQTYYFSAWIATITDSISSGGNQPIAFASLKFEVKGNTDANWTTLGTLLKSPDKAGLWVQSFGTWYSGLNTGATLRLYDSLIPLSDSTYWGNDFALDDISFINSCQNVSSGAKPQLSSIISLCDHGGEVNLNTQINKIPQITFTWFKNNIQLSDTTNTLSNITQTGIYTICVDSANCIQKDTVTVISNLKINLGPNLNLCSPSYAYLNSNLANTTGLGLAWYKNDINLPGDDSTNLFVSTPGEYKLVVTDLVGNNCNASDSVNITSSAPIPHDTTYCFSKGQTTASISVTGTGAFGWFTAATGGKKVGQGNSFTVTGLTGQDTTLWVKDTTTFSKIVGYSRNTSYGPSNTNNLLQNTILFTANDNFTIDSISFNLYSPTGKSGWTGKSLSTTLIDENTNVTVAAVLPIVVTGTNLIFSSQGGNEIYIRMAVNLSIVSGHKYSFSAIGEGDVEGQTISGTRLTYPLNDGQIVFTGYGTGSKDIWPGFYDWLISYGTYCEPVPVRVIEKCTLDCTMPISPTLSPSNTNFCISGTQTLTAACSNSSAATFVYSFYKKGTPDIMVEASSGSKQYTASTSGTYYAVIADLADTNQCNVQTPTAVITFDSLPTVDVGQDTTICKGATVTLTASGGATYQWDNGLGSGSTQNVSPTTNTIYIVTASNNGCSATGSVEVYVNDCNCPSVQTNSVSPLCLYKAVIALDTITVTTEPGSWAITSYPPGSNPGSINSNIFNAIGKDTGAYELTFTLDTLPKSGCARTSVQHIQIKSLPVANAGNNESVCNGQFITLSADGAGNNGKYIWNNLSTTDTIIVNPIATTTYSVTVTDIYGCTANAQVTVAVNPNPVSSVKATNKEICSGVQDTLIASGGNSYQWNTNNINDTIFVSPQSNTLYSVTVENNNGCFAVDTISIAVIQPPNPPDIDDAIICTNDSVKQVSLIINNTNNNYIYKWFTVPVGGVYFSKNDMITLFNLTQDTSYFIETTTIEGCNSSSRKKVSVYFYSPPQQPSFTYSPSVIFTNTPVLFTNTSSSDVIQYFWSFGMGQGVSDKQNPYFTYSDSGYFLVQLSVTNIHNCTATDSIRIYVNEQLKIWVPQAFTPNNDGQNDILFVRGPVKSMNLEIYNQWGLKVFQSTNQSDGWDGKFDGVDQPVGNYAYILRGMDNSGKELNTQGVITLIR